MEEALSGWSDFLVAEVGATAAFTGLLIVAVSINLQRILAFPQLPGRAAEMLIMLLGALLVCSVGLIPHQPLKVLGWEMAAIGLLMLIAPVAIQVRSVIVVRHQPISWWLWRMVLVQCACWPILIGAVYMIAGNGNGIYGVAAGVLATLAATVWNSWIC